MFERTRDYPTAITCHEGEVPERAQQAAIKWVVEQQKVVGGQVLLYVPSKQDLEQVGGLISRFSELPEVAICTWRRVGKGSWFGGPVLAAWPDRAKLAEIADDRRTRALCVIPWAKGDTTAWEEAAKPELLAGATSTTITSTLDPVVIEALQRLTQMVNQANNLHGSFDRRAAIATLKILHNGGYRLPEYEVYAWAFSHGWPATGAEELRELAAKVDAGRVVQLKGGSPLQNDILDVWRAEAADSAS